MAMKLVTPVDGYRGGRSRETNVASYVAQTVKN